MITLLGCPAIRPSTLCECGRKTNNKQGEGRRKARKTQQTKPQTQPPKQKTHGLREKQSQEQTRGRQNAPRISCAEITAYVRKRQTENTEKKTAKHKATGRSQENSGRTKKGVSVSAYLLPDLCSLQEGGERDRRREDQTNGLFKGQSLKGQKDKHHLYSRITCTETNHHLQNSSTRHDCKSRFGR